MEVVLAQPRGFCAGVERAVQIVDQALIQYPEKKVFVFHEIVHNRYVLNDFRARGVIFTESIEDVPEDAVLIFSAHGAAKKVIKSAINKVEIVIDATCPLVIKVHKEAQRNEEEGREVILIGHNGHQEVIGTMGQLKNEVHLVQSVQDVANLSVKDSSRLSYVTQTTLSIDDTIEIISKLKSRFPEIKGPNLKDICYATQNRQNAVKGLIKIVDVILVVGSQNSSNSRRLQELALANNVPAYLIDSQDDVDLSWFKGIEKIGITAGASASEVLVKLIIDFLKDKFSVMNVSTMPGITETVKFKLPKI